MALVSFPDHPKARKIVNFLGIFNCVWHLHTKVCVGGIGLPTLLVLKFLQLATNACSGCFQLLNSVEQALPPPSLPSSVTYHACLSSVAEHKSCDIYVTCALRQSDQHNLTMPRKSTIHSIPPRYRVVWE